MSFLYWHGFCSKVIGVAQDSIFMMFPVGFLQGGGIKNQKFIISKFCRLKSRMDLTGLKTRCQQDHVPFWTLYSIVCCCCCCCCCLFQLLESPLYFLTPGPSLHFQEQQCLPPLWPFFCSPISHWLWSGKVLCCEGLIWLRWVHRWSKILPVSKSLTFITSSKSLLPWKVHIFRLQRLGCGYLWGPLYCLPQLSRLWLFQL